MTTTHFRNVPTTSMLRFYFLIAITTNPRINIWTFTVLMLLNRRQILYPVKYPALKEFEVVVICL